MGSGSLTNELIDFFHASPQMPTPSAFLQQRSKIKPEAFRSIFDGFNETITKGFSEKMPIFAVDGSDIQIATNPGDTGSYYPGSNGQKGYNLLHLNALYEIDYHIYADSIIQKSKNCNEHKALQEMVDRSTIPEALIIADRGYESYNSMAHIQEKGWYFLIRIKDGHGSIKSNLELPKEKLFDLNYKDPASFYGLSFRIARFQISEDTYETVLTNLDKEQYPLEKLKQLYALRWGIETSFRDLKYTIGMLDFHSKKVMCIQQEIYAHLIMYNFAQMITSHVVIEKKQRKYTNNANFSVASHLCRLFYRGKTTSPDLETIIAKNVIPIRPDRHGERKATTKIFHGFLYRVA